MAWMKRLAETYDLYQDLAGIVKDGQPVLLPVSHSTINAQIEVTLNEAGEFVMGKVVEKGDEVTIIPVTEDSAARSSGVAPHPLCDKLCYVAGDYSKNYKMKCERYLNESAFRTFFCFKQ